MCDVCLFLAYEYHVFETEVEDGYGLILSIFFFLDWKMLIQRISDFNQMSLRAMQRNRRELFFVLSVPTQ